MNETERFNAVYEVGSLVRYWPGAKFGEGIPSKTRTQSWLIGGHTPVVSVSGYAGGIALTHVVVDRECFEEVVRSGDYDACGKDAVGYRIDPNGEGIYPVCAQHNRPPFPSNWTPDA